MTIKNVSIGDQFTQGKHQLFEVVDFIEKKSLVTGQVVGHICMAKSIRGLSTNTFEVPFATVARNRITPNSPSH